jgi:predicted nucleic acid-binding protein
MSRPAYASPSFSAQYVGNLIESLIRNTKHRFIPEDFSILDSSLIDLTSIHSHDHVTDTYLLALARRHNAELATMDMKLSVAAVPDGKRHLCQIP